MVILGLPEPESSPDCRTDVQPTKMTPIAIDFPTIPGLAVAPFIEPPGGGGWRKAYPRLLAC
jgi:hypothetical protein